MDSKTEKPLSFDDLEEHKDAAKWNPGCPYNVGDKLPMGGEIKRIKCVSAFWITREFIMKGRSEELDPYPYIQHPTCPTVLFFVETSA
jgi:hypothetical protein